LTTSFPTLISFFLSLTDVRLTGWLRSAFNAKFGNRRGAIIDGEQADELLTLYSS
jgi:hypothetical protein